MKKILFLIIVLLIPNTVKALTYSFDDCIDNESARFKDEKNEIIIVRFQGITVPRKGDIYKEDEPFAVNSIEFVCNYLSHAQNIEVELNSENKKDNYGRDLAWVKVDGVLLQSLVLENGYGKYYEYNTDKKYDEELKKVELEARERKVGIWGLEKDDLNDNIEIEEDDIVGKIVKKIDKTIKKVFNGISNFFKKIF